MPERNIRIGSADISGLAALYNISVATLAAPGNELGIFESTDDMYNQADLNNFWANFAPYVSSIYYPYRSDSFIVSHEVRQSKEKHWQEIC